MEKFKKRKKKKNKLLYVVIIVMIAFGGALAYYAYDYYLYWQDGRIAQENTDVMRDMFQGQMEDINQLILTAPQGNDTGDATNDLIRSLGLSFEVSPLDAARELASNPDIVAYLFIEGTNVNNVVVQGLDNAYYLHRDMFGNRNVNGTIFMDYRNTPDFTDPNTILYGHNMGNGTMFHNLRYYMQQEFFEAHPHIKVITDDTIFVYEIFSAFTTHISFNYIQVFFEYEEEFGELVDEMMRRSAYDTGVTANGEDRIIVLSTCTNVNRNTRIVVAGRLAMELTINDENTGLDYPS